MRLLTLSTLLLIAALLSGCGDTPVEPGQLPKAQLIVAGEQYINWAWGYHHNAKFIDRFGHVMVTTYQLADSIWLLADQNVLTDSEMHRLVAGAVEVPVTVSQDSVGWMYRLTLSSQSGPYSDTTWMGADQGATTWFGFWYEPSSATYHRVNLLVEGDIRYQNLSPSAGSLVNVLKSIVWVQPVQ